jgi:hypothetical protein
VYNQADSSGTLGTLQLSGFGANNMAAIDDPPGIFDDPLPAAPLWFTFNGDSPSIPTLVMNDGGSVTFDNDGTDVTVFEWAANMPTGTILPILPFDDDGKFGVRVLNHNGTHIYMNFSMKTVDESTVEVKIESNGAYDGTHTVNSSSVSFYTTIPMQ